MAGDSSSEESLHHLELDAKIRHAHRKKENETYIPNLIDGIMSWSKLPRAEQ